MKKRKIVVFLMKRKCGYKMNDFLDKDYELPDKSDYMKFKNGLNTFRALSSAAVGYEYWNNDNKPIRSKKEFVGFPSDIRVEKDGRPSAIKHFWAFVVWNCELKKIQILEITQTSILKAMKALIDNPRWGSPKEYDITITKSGEGLGTEYIVQGNPPSELSEEVKRTYESRSIDLSALYRGENPFDKGISEKEIEDLKKLSAQSL